MRGNRSSHKVTRYTISLLAGVALGIFSLPAFSADEVVSAGEVVGAGEIIEVPDVVKVTDAIETPDVTDVVKEEIVGGYKITKQLSGKAKNYLEESPYVERRKRIEAQRDVPIRRRPMRFGKGNALPEMPSFEPLGSLDSANPIIDVGEAIPAPEKDPIEEKLPTPKVAMPDVDVPEALPPVSAPVVLDEIVPDVAMPDLKEEVPLDIITAPELAPKPSVVDMPVAPTRPVIEAEPESDAGFEPKSIMDSVLSIFDDAEPEVKKQVVAPYMPRKLIDKPAMGLDNILSAPAPRVITTPPVGAPVKSIIIDKSPDGYSSLERTRDIVVPPEMKSLEKSEVASIPPLMLTGERFSENLIMPEPPTFVKSDMQSAKSDKMPTALPDELPEVAEVAEIIDVPAEPVSVSVPEQELAMAEQAKTIEPAGEGIAEIVETLSVDVDDAAPKVEAAKTPDSAFMAAVSGEDKQDVETVVDKVAAVIEPAAPKPEMQHIVVMQNLDNAKTVDKLDTASVVVEEAQSVELSSGSKMMLKNFPSGINTPDVKAIPEKKVEISRATVPDLEISKPDIKKHEALGISIEVKTPNIDVNDYLINAYEAAQSDNFGLAMQYYNEILSKYPNNEDATLGMATLSHRLGDTKTARELYKKVLSKSPRSTDALNNFLVLISEESPEKALGEMLSLEAKNPYYAAIPAQIAAIYAQKGDMQSAISKIARAISINPDNLMYRYNLAVMLDHAGQRPQAIKAYSMVKKAIEHGGKIATDVSHIQERLTFLLSNRAS